MFPYIPTTEERNDSSWYLTFRHLPLRRLDSFALGVCGLDSLQSSPYSIHRYSKDQSDSSNFCYWNYRRFILLWFFNDWKFIMDDTSYGCDVPTKRKTWCHEPLNQFFHILLHYLEFLGKCCRLFVQQPPFEHKLLPWWGLCHFIQFQVTYHSQYHSTLVDLSLISIAINRDI